MLCYQKIEPVDFNECTRIMTAAFDWDTALHTDLLHDGPRGYDDGSLIQKRYSDPSCQCYKVLLGKKMIGGYVLICQNDCGILDLLFLDPTLGNRGFGSEIWRHIEQSHPSITHWTVETPSYSTRNHHFYTRKCGFHFTKEYFYPDGASSYFFQKDLCTKSAVQAE